MYRIPPAKIRPRMTSAVKKTMALLERVFQLGDEVVDVLDADRQAHQAFVDAELGAHVLGQRGVGHDRRVLDEALDAAQALGEGEQLAALEEPPGALQPALAGDGADRRRVDALNTRVGRRFDPPHLRIGPNRFSKLLGPGKIDEARLEPGAALA